MSEWMPIETAPKDETELLLYAPGLDAPYWMSLSRNPERYPADSGIVVGRFYDGNWVCHGGEASWENSTAPIHVDPTHWMPLPAAPQEDQLPQRSPR